MTKRTTTSPPLTEKQIIAASVGERQPNNSSIYLAPYDPSWPIMYKHLRECIQEALSERILILEHVGSTSVPGLSAKPIIDIVLVVADSSAENLYVKALEEKGFTLRIREPDWHQHRMLKSQDPKGNLHVFSDGCEEIEKNSVVSRLASEPV